MDIKAFNTMVGRNIRFLREERGLSVEDLSKLSQGLSRPLITKIENNRTEDNKHKKQIALEHIEMLANALKVPVNVILENNEDFNERLKKLEYAMDHWKIDKDVVEAVDRMLVEASSRGPREQVKVLRLAGGIDYNRGLIESTIQCLQCALEIATNTLDCEMINAIRYNLAGAYYLIGKYEILIRLIEQNLEDEKEHDKRGRDLYLLGIAYVAQRNWNNAIESLLQSIVELQASEKKLLEGRCFQALGEVYKNTNQIERSIQSAEKALQIAQDTNDEMGEIYTLKMLGEVYLEQGQQQIAILYFSNALEKAHHIGNFRKMEILKMEFYISICKKDLNRMKKYLSEIEEIEISPIDLAEMYKETARMANQQENYQESIHFYEKAIQKLEK